MASIKNSKDDSKLSEKFVIGDYRVSRTIGQGTYGKVRLGYHNDTKEKVAVKVIEKSQVKSAKQIARLQREIRFLKLLHHPHIIRLYDVIETTEHIFIVMEYATGGELFDYIVANKRVKENEARSFFRMVIKAIDYCHKNAIIHRDLKPGRDWYLHNVIENLLLDENKQIKIIDFGFGNNYSNDKLLDTFCGSPFYAAPEMILGKKYGGPEVDMWSLGVILFALLCGHLPFDDENMKELYKKIANGSYRCPDYVMPNARHLISRLITVDPKKRATMREVFLHPWVNEGFSYPPESLYKPPKPMASLNDLSNDIVNRLIIFGYSTEDIRKAFEDHLEINSPNPIRSTYYLLKDMVEREQARIKSKKSLDGLCMNDFFNHKENSMATLVSASNHSLYPISGSLSNDTTIQAPPGAHISNRTHSTKVPAQDMDVFSLESSRRSIAVASPPIPADATQKGYFGFSLAQAAASQIQRWYSVPSSIYNTLSETTNSLLFSSDTDPKNTAQQKETTPCIKTITSKEPSAIINDIIRVLSGTDARWHFENDFRIVCEMDANALSTEEERNLMEIDSKAVKFHGKAYVGPPTVSFSIDVAKVSNGQHYGVFFKRLHGGLWNYKRVCGKLVQMMKN